MNNKSAGNSMPFRALLVEDDPTFALLIKRIIGSLYENATIELHESGVSALKSIYRDKTKLDLAIVDLGLPDIPGVNVIREINLLTSDIPILVASVISSEKSLIDCIKAGARGYVLKDDSEEMMRKSIEQVMQGNYPVSPMLARYLFKMAQTSPIINSSEIPDLTKKEMEVLQNISQGKSYSETALAMGVNITTIQSHIRSLYKKLNVHSQVQATNIAKKHGLI